MATFHPFPNLPVEIRAAIWSMTVRKRTLDVHSKQKHGDWGGCRYAISSTPLPAILHACHESRNMGLYRRAFTLGYEPRYLWVNFEKDLVSIRNDGLSFCFGEAVHIRRLRFESSADEMFIRFGVNGLRQFSNLEELHVVCKTGLDKWTWYWEDVYWQCPRENVRFIDKESGKTIDIYKLEEMEAEFLSS